MPSNPDNGTKRFEDFVHRVELMDAERTKQIGELGKKLDGQGRALVRIEALLEPVPPKVESLRRDVDKLEVRGPISVAKITSIASVVAACIAAFGYWLTTAVK